MLMLTIGTLQRPSRWATAALLGMILACGGLRGAETPDELAVYLDAGQTDDAVQQAQQKLLTRESRPLVEALARLLQSDQTNTAARLRIIQLLGALKTDAAAALLQKICTPSTLTILDVSNWGALARGVQAGASGNDSSLSGRIWKSLSESERKAVEKLTPITDANAPVSPQGIALLNGLNRLLDDQTLCTDADLAKLPATEAVNGLVGRWRQRNKKDGPPEDRFMPNEYHQLNNDLLRGQFHDGLQATFDLPVHQYESRTANAAIAELMKMSGQPVAEAAIIGLDPDPAQARQHLDALGAIRSEAATERLFKYLICDAVSASNRARDLLTARLDFDATTVERLLGDMLNKYLYADDNQASLPAIANRNLLELAVALPSESSRVDILKRCLGLKNKELRDAAFNTLKLAPKLVHSEDIRTALADRLVEDKSGGHALQTLSILQLSEDPLAVPLVASLLEHEDKVVRVKAARAMEMLTGKHLGTNPAVWKKWYTDNHPAAGEQPEQPAPVEDEDDADLQ